MNLLYQKTSIQGKYYSKAIKFLYKINRKLLTTNIDHIWCKDAYIIFAPDNNVTTPKII